MRLDYHRRSSTKASRWLTSRYLMTSNLILQLIVPEDTLD
jgi:hypothetical protein